MSPSFYNFSMNKESALFPAYVHVLYVGELAAHRTCVSPDTPALLVACHVLCFANYNRQTNHFALSIRLQG